MRKIGRRVFFVIKILLLWFVVHSLVIVYVGLNDQIKDADAIVVLGNAVRTNGVPSERLQARLNEALRLYQDDLAKYIIVSGGVDASNTDEARAMANYLVQKGVSRDKIIVDSKGVNTEATAENTKQILETKNLESVIVVSQYYHISRILLAFKKAGVAPVYHSHARYIEQRDAFSVFREFFAFYKYLIIP